MRVPHLLLVAAGLAAARQGAAADPPALLSTDSWTPSSRGDLAVDAGVIVGFPAALPTGLSRGAGAGVAKGVAGDNTVAIGARIAWVTATESSMAWRVTHDDLRLRATAALQRAVGRGTFGVRLGLGGTLVHESRLRNQGERAGLTGDDLRTSAYELLPAADLDALVQLGIAGPWRVVMTGGPSIVLLDGSVHASWTAQLGVAWQP
jgi:hypothetical protein